uniref:Amino acid transporter n=1 Tax=Caenorhabditis japonica TaxID=281687 RepID=A0A8R1I2J8_CAEJA
MGRGWLFQQDNDPKHTSPLRQGLVRTASSKRFDLTKPISRPESHRASLGGQKFEQLKEEWTKIRLQILTNLIESMQKDLGIFLVTVIHPGDPSIKGTEISDVPSEGNVSPLDTFLDLVRNMFPENIIQATFERMQTTYVAIRPKIASKNGTVGNIIVKRDIAMTKGMNILGIIVFCTGFGIVISQLGERARIVVDFFVILDAVIMRWVVTLMWFAPLGITCLICGNLLELDDLSDIATVLALYVFTVCAGLVLHTIITVPLMYFFITRENPLPIFRGMIQAVVTAFGTASGGATLPMSMQCLEDHCGVDRRISRFVLPLGSTINMEGNALYEAVAVIFIAQLNNVQLSLAEVLTVSITATVASIGLGSVPAGLVSILLILNTVGLPIRDVSMLFTVDWLLDRVRTAVNVLGDAYAASVVQHLLQKKLDKSDARNDYKSEIKGEIELLKSAATSRRPSFTMSEASKDLFLNHGANSRIGSRIGSCRASSTNLHLTWRNTPLEPPYTPLPNDENV